MDSIVRNLEDETDKNSNTDFKIENGEDHCRLEELSLPTSPLNLSPKPVTIEREKKLPKLTPLNRVSQRESPTNLSLQRLTPPNSWTGLCRTPYFFPAFQFPFLYPSLENPRSVPLPTIPTDKSEDQNQRIPTLNLRKTKEDVDAKDDENAPDSVRESSSFGIKDGSTSPQHYQVKWSNHASRLSSFISSLEGDVASSDTIISAKDGTNFYAHRLVLASASPFFTRTLKNIPKDQHAVIVIPRVPSRYVAAILSFCYTGTVGFPREDLKTVLELAEDLEITGLLSEKEKHIFDPPRRQMSPSSVFTFTPPASFLPDGQYESWSTGFTPLYKPSTAYSPGPSSTSLWKREAENPINYSQTMKRIKSESDIQKYPPKKTLKSRNSESTLNFQKHDSSDHPNCLLPYPNHSSPSSDCAKPLTESSFEESQTPVRTIPRPAGTGSRVLLWRFLLQLLHDRRYSPYYIRWLDRSQGIFRIMESDKVAQLWGMARKNKNMTYEKMSRGMRTYYKRSILFHLDGTKLIYRFNIQEPEIQHQLRYHELLSQKPEEEHLSYDLTNTATHRENKSVMSPIQRPKCTTPSSGTPSYAGTPNNPLSPNFLPDVAQNMYDLGSLFPPRET